MNSSVKHLRGYYFAQWTALHFVTFILIFGFISCRKSNRDVDLSSPSALETATKAWLMAKTPLIVGNRTQRVADVSKLLDYSAARTEKADGKNNFIVVPMKEGLYSAYNKGKKTRNFLLLTQGPDGKVHKGNIVQVLSDAPIIPVNTFSALENGTRVEIDASFTFLSIFDRYVYGISYEKNFITSFTELGQSKKRSVTNTETAVNSTQTMATCINWYLITTVYYTDGSSQSFEEYIGTTCSGGCMPDEWCTPQPDPGGGGTEGLPMPGADTDYDYAKRRHINWTVYQGGTGERVVSQELVKGKPDNTPFGGFFTSVSHEFSEVRTINTAYLWQESSSSASSSGAIATFAVSGNFRLFPFDWEVKGGSHSTSYSACFP